MSETGKAYWRAVVTWIRRGREGAEREKGEKPAKHFRCHCTAFRLSCSQQPKHNTQEETSFSYSFSSWICWIIPLTLPLSVLPFRPCFGWVVSVT